MNPTWPMASASGVYDCWRPHLEGAGFGELQSFFYDEDVTYSHQAWRGRVRACNGVIALGAPDRIAELDGRLAALLAARFPDPLVIPHRVFAISGRLSAPEESRGRPPR
jgi:hypothetical protein